MPQLYKTGKRYIFWNDGSVTTIDNREFERMLQLGELGKQTGEFRYGSVYVWQFAKCDVQCLYSDVATL